MNSKFPQLDPDAPDVPEGLRPRTGVEYGCGSPTCADCYEADAQEPDEDEVARFEAEGGAPC